MKPLKITLQILFALSLLTLSLCDCSGPVGPVYDGPWEKVRVPGLIGHYALHFNSPNDGWSCGFYTIGHWDGNRWEIIKELGNTTTERYLLFGISSVTPNDIWFCGTIEQGSFPYTYNGVVVRYFNGDWEITELDIVTGISSIHMFSDGTGWGGGSMGILYYDGSDWTLVKTGEINTVFFNSETDGWACGLSNIYHWDGTEWTLNFSDSSVWFRDIYFTGPNDGWAAGGYQTIKHYHYDGSGWTRITDPVIRNKPLDAIHFVDSEWGWAINEHTYFYDGQNWTAYEDDFETGGKYDIFCVNKNDVWISGYPEFLHFSGFKK